ncbi:MAG: AMP-binding protein [Flavobacteriaceae bacterium]|nr:AMP-binding protein [Flavobacteriaceae bacterium]
MKVHSCFKINNISFKSEKEILEYLQNTDIYSYNFVNNWLDSDEHIYVKTSGSTGVPKTIKIRKQQMKASAIATAKFFDLKEDSKVLLCLSTGFIAGKMMLVRAMVSGWNITLSSVSSFPLKEINCNFDFVAMVPMQVSNSLEKIHLFNKVLIGGAAIDSGLNKNLQNIDTAVFSSYGMTETVSHIAIKPINNKAGIFMNVSNNNYKTLDNIEINTDNRSCLNIVAKQLNDDIVQTNDIVKIINKKEFVWLGRYDNIINSGAVKISPEDIEKKLEQYINNRFFISWQKDSVLGQKVILIIESEKNININLSDILDKYETPKEIYFCKKFKETTNGKINREQTRVLVVDRS